MNLEKVDIFKEKVRSYKKKMNTVSSRTLDVKKKVVSQQDTKSFLSLSKNENIIENSFVTDENN